MPNPLLIFRTGWMDTYNGIGEIHNGGSYIAEHGEGVKCGISVKKEGDSTAM